MINQFSRTELLLGSKAIDKLKNSSVCVFGVGGVGSYVVEALARSGVGAITIIDNDDISVTNINRQLPAVMDTVGKLKVDVVKNHILQINPDCKVTALNMFYIDETKDDIDFSKFDYVVDAIDTVSAKLLIAQKCTDLGAKLISSMGTGNKLDPTQFEITDISKTSMCPLARVMRRELKARGIYKLKVLYSKEKPITPFEIEDTEITAKKSIPGSVSFVPSVGGLIIGGEVVKDLIK